MAHITPRDDSDLTAGRWLVEGLPGVGLVGKIATDHLVEEFDMQYVASVHCDGLPAIGVYHEGERDLQPPVRLYHDPDSDLMALQSDVPISPQAAADFSACITGWMAENGVTPLYLAGLPEEKSGVPELVGVATGGAGNLLDEADVGRPVETGVVSGPTGALMNRAAEEGLGTVGLIVEADQQFPDPEAARVLLEKGVCPITGIDVDVQELVERAEEIREQKEKLAKRMQEAEPAESSQAQPLRMYQ